MNSFISKIILGTAQLGMNYGINNSTGKPNAIESLRILKLAHQSGINMLDTAEGYGESQSLIGQYHAQSSKKFKVITKFSLESEDIQSKLNKSLNELQVEQIEGYFFHRFSERNQKNIAETLNHFKSKGLIKKIGVSIYDNKEFDEAIKLDWIDIIQIPFNLFDNWSIRGELIQLAKSKGKEIHARSIFLQGLLFKNPFQLNSFFSELSPELEKINEIAKNENISVATLALHYALQFKEIDKILIGIERETQLSENLSNLNYSPSQSFIEEIAKIRIHKSELIDPRNWPAPKK